MADICGVIYILTNPSFPEYVKIGYSENIEKRIKILNNNPGLPFPFRLYATYSVRTKLSGQKIQSLMEKLCPALQTSGKKDKDRIKLKGFFEMTPEDAYKLFRAVAELSGTEKNLRKMQDGVPIMPDAAKSPKSQRKRGDFSFQKIGIKIGEEIEFIGDSSIKCRVISDRKIEYDGVETYVSTFAAYLLGKKSVQGTRYFKYKGERLCDLRDRLEGRKQ